VILYDAVHERTLRKAYKMKYVPVYRSPSGTEVGEVEATEAGIDEPMLKTGYKVRYVPVYRSPSGVVVGEDEATVPGITIVEVPAAEASRAERKRAIDKLTDILFAEYSIFDKRPIVDWTKLKDAIKAMALEADFKLEVGVLLTKKLVADEFYHEFPEAEYVVSFLVESGLKAAIVPLTSLFKYETSWDHRGAEDFVEDLARTTLRTYVADNPDFQLEAARAALALHAEAKVPYYRDLVKTWAMELLLGLANSTTSTERDWANERLKELEATAEGGRSVETRA
jgi:hypothetical protein